MTPNFPAPRRVGGESFEKIDQAIAAVDVEEEGTLKALDELAAIYPGDTRWIHLARDHFKKGFMALRRCVRDGYLR